MKKSEVISLHSTSVFGVSNGFIFGPKCVENPERSCKAFVGGSTQILDNFRGYRTPDFIRYFGYPVEEHKITTEDGYILTFYRLPPKVSNAIPVLLMHGLLASSSQWFLQPSHKSLAFMLHEAGYDVWLGNSRGTTYSSEHVSMNPMRDLEYWDFSSYEMGKYDVPAALEYILNVTSHGNLYYIGHSLGGMQVILGAALNPEINLKIRTLFALGPCVYTGNTSNPFMNTAAYIAAPYSRFNTLNRISRGQYFPAGVRELITTGAELCRSSLINCAICARKFQMILGNNPCQTNYTWLPAILTQMPDRSSFKLWSHSAQAIVSGIFGQYDFDSMENMRRYGSVKPPEYSWGNVKLPTVLIWGEKDDLVVPKDIAKTAAALGDNLKENIKVSDPKWNHVDFLFGVDADVLVYRRMLDIMNGRKYG